MNTFNDSRFVRFDGLKGYLNCSYFHIFVVLENIFVDICHSVCFKVLLRDDVGF